MTKRHPPRSFRFICALGVLGAFLAAAGGASAIQQSVTVQARWRVLPYQVLEFVDGGNGASAAVYTVPEATYVDSERGYIEDEYVFRLLVVSNTAWKLQVLSPTTPSASAEIRRHGGEYEPISGSAVVIASGANGTYEIGIDVRIPLDGNAAVPGDSIDLAFTLMSL